MKYSKFLRVLKFVHENIWDVNERADYEIQVNSGNFRAGSPYYIDGHRLTNAN